MMFLAIRKAPHFYNIRGLSTCSQYTKILISDGIANITMCHTSTRNSLSVKMMQKVISDLSQSENDPNVRLVVIGAEGPIFSSGHNLKELSSDLGKEQQVKVFKLASQLMCKIIDSPLPVVARVDGVAAAAGCQLVAQCDMAFCTEKSQFSTPGANFGIFCSTPGIALARCVHKSTAMKMLLTGLPITAKEAESAGLVTKVCTDLDEEIKKTYQAISGKSRSVIALGKRFYYHQINEGIKKAYEMGEQVMVDNLQMEDGKEGIGSFIEKRQPLWKH